MLSENESEHMVALGRLLQSKRTDIVLLIGPCDHRFVYNRQYGDKFNLISRIYRDRITQHLSALVTP